MGWRATVCADAVLGCCADIATFALCLCTCAGPIALAGPSLRSGYGAMWVRIRTPVTSPLEVGTPTPPTISAPADVDVDGDGVTNVCT